MPIRQQIFIVSLSVSIFLVIIELVRKRRLKEEYSWLWILTGIGMIALSLWYDLLLFLSKIIGIVVPTSTIFLAGLIFSMLILLHFSIKISKLTEQVKNLSQELAIQAGEIMHNDHVLHRHTTDCKHNQE